MDATIGVYETHDKAIEAVAALKDAGYPVDKVSVIGKTTSEKVDEHMRVTEKNPLKLGGVEAGTTLGIALGVLTGVGVLAIPGFGFLFGAGAVAGAIAGFDIGLIGGGLATVLLSMGFKKETAAKYQEALKSGKYLLVAEGNKDEVAQAQKVLAQHDTHTGLETH